MEQAFSILFLLRKSQIDRQKFIFPLSKSQSKNNHLVWGDYFFVKNFYAKKIAKSDKIAQNRFVIFGDCVTLVVAKIISALKNKYIKQLHTLIKTKHR